MKHPTSAALRTLWDSTRLSLQIPDAATVVPDELGAAAADVFTLAAPLHEANYASCGAAWTLRYGRDLAGESFLARWPDDDRAALARHLAPMSAGTTGIVFGVTAETAAGGFTTFEMLLLPIATERGVGAVGSMSRVGGHEETNRIRARIVAQFLRSVRVLPLASIAPPPRWTSPRPRLPLRPQGKTYGHLTVLAGGK